MFHNGSLVNCTFGILVSLVLLFVLFKGDAVDQILKIDETGLLTDDRNMVGIPADEDFICFNGGSVSHLEHRTGFQFIAFKFRFADRISPEVVIFLHRHPQSLRGLAGIFTPLLFLLIGDLGIEDNGTAVLVHDHHFTLGVGNGTDVFITQHTVKTGSDLRLTVGAVCGTADVEGTHGQLSTGLTDGLGSDDTEGVTFDSQAVTRQILTVALDTDSMTGLAGQSGTDEDLLDLAVVDDVTNGRCKLFTGTDDEGGGIQRILKVPSAESSDDTVTQRHDHLVTFGDGTGPDTVGGSAILFTADDILSNVDKTAGHVTGVSGFQSGISQTFTGTVGGDEVLHHRKTFTEVGDDRTLDNIA